MATGPAGGSTAHQAGMAGAILQAAPGGRERIFDDRLPAGGFVAGAGSVIPAAWNPRMRRRQRAIRLDGYTTS
jgi:hypothetical protein